MRTIKFRVYNIKTKSWIHGPHKNNSLDGINLFGETILLGGFLDGVSIKDLNDIVALQYTGLRDKNGKDIFEGDLIKIQINDNPEDLEWSIEEIIFFDGCFSFKNSVTHQETLRDYIVDANDIICDFEIIGNIFDNPELIE